MSPIGRIGKGLQNLTISNLFLEVCHVTNGRIFKKMWLKRVWILLMQLQAQLGEGHVSVVNAKEAILTEKHLALVLDYIEGGSLTKYVSDRWHQASHTGLFLSEDESRYFFRVSPSHEKKSKLPSMEFKPTQTDISSLCSVATLYETNTIESSLHGSQLLICQRRQLWFQKRVFMFVAVLIEFHRPVQMQHDDSW